MNLPQEFLPEDPWGWTVVSATESDNGEDGTAYISGSFKDGTEFTDVAITLSDNEIKIDSGLFELATMGYEESSNEILPWRVFLEALF